MLTTTGMDLRTYEQVLNAEVAVLRQNLQQLSAWPEAGDMLLELMHTSRWDSLALSKTDYDWLPYVVEAAIKGVDIGGQYPAFFQKLLTNNQLRESFCLALHNAMAQANISPSPSSL